MLLSFLLRRLLVIIPVLFLITLLGFVVTLLIPTDPAAMMLSEKAAQNEEIVRAVRARWGLDKPPHERYLLYMQHLLSGDLGESYTTKRPVKEDLKEFFPATVELAIPATLFALLVGIPLGIIAAVYKDRWADHISRFISLIGVSLPIFWLGLLALSFFYAYLDVLPGPGRLNSRIQAPPRVTGMLTIDSLMAGNIEAFSSALQHLILPSLVLGLYGMGLITRITRSAMVETMTQDFVRTARSKGLIERVVVIKHVLRNAAIPTVTAIGLAFGSLMAGAVMTETIFAWPGIGRYAADTALRTDFAPIIGVTLITALVYIIVNLLVDLSYVLLDPRIRL